MGNSAEDFEEYQTGGERFAKMLDSQLRSHLKVIVDNTKFPKHFGVRNLKSKIDKTFARSLLPPPKLALSEWADKFAYLSPENSAEPGKWTTIGYQKGPLNAITDKATETITFKKSARVGYTKMIDHTIGYFAHQDPSPMMVVQPTIDDAKGYSVDEVIPMIRDTPVLSAIAISEKDKGSGVTQLKRKFINGASVILVGANSPRGFRRVTIRVVMFDEVDGYPVGGAGNEGDQIKLGIKRTETFWNRKIIIGSTPTVRGVSRISKSFEQSDKRFFAPPCPHCNERVVLKFSPAAEYGQVVELPEGTKFAYMTWPKGEPENAVFECEHCGTDIEEKDKAWMIETGAELENYGWVATAPFSGHAGFHIWAAYSVFPNAAWGKLAKEFVDAKKANDSQALQVFVNTVLGEDWESVGERVDDGVLEKRREDYGDIAPRDVVVVTAGVDIQGNRIEVEKVGWAMNGESWGLGKTVIFGDPTGPDIWSQLDELLDTRIPHELGFELPVMAACVDSGYLTQTVVSWCHSRWSKKYWAIKGMGGPGRSIWPKRAAKTKGKLTQFTIGVDAAKELIYARLRIPNPSAGYSHFNMSYDNDHFEQLTAEEVKIKYFKGMPVRQWEVKGGGNKRNEALDIRVYAMAALEGLKVMGLDMHRREQALKEMAGDVVEPRPVEVAEEKIAAPAPQVKAVKRKAKKRRTSGSSIMLRR